MRPLTASAARGAASRDRYARTAPRRSMLRGKRRRARHCVGDFEHVFELVSTRQRRVFSEEERISAGSWKLRSSHLRTAKTSSDTLGQWNDLKQRRDAAVAQREMQKRSTVRRAIDSVHSWKRIANAISLGFYTMRSLTNPHLRHNASSQPVSQRPSQPIC